MIFNEELINKCDFSNELLEPVEEQVKIYGLTTSDIQRINGRVKSSIRQQEIRQGKSLKVASKIFSN